MKRIILSLIVVFFTTNIAFAQKTDTLCMYFEDNSATNIREKPNNGKIIKTISTQNYELGVCVCEVRNGWWKIASKHIDNISTDSVITLNSPSGEAWVHYSVLAFNTRNYNNEKITLHKSPNAKAPATWSFHKEMQLRPLDYKNGWIKVITKDGKHSGWMEMKWFCGNPLTNCC